MAAETSGCRRTTNEFCERENRRTLCGMKLETIRNGIPTASLFQGFEHGDLFTLTVDGQVIENFTCLIDHDPIDAKTEAKTQDWINAMEDKLMDDQMDEWDGDPALPRGWDIDEMSGW